MDDNTASVLLATVPAAISAVVAWAVTYYSMRDTRQQQWRERKIETYAEVIRALSLLHSYQAEYQGHFEGRSTLPDSYQKHLNTQYANAMETLRLHRGAGGFLLTPVAALAAAKLVSHFDFEGGDPTPDACDDNLKAIKRAKYVVLKEASADLKVDFPT